MNNAASRVTSAELLVARRQAAIATAFCNMKYEGEIKKKGSKIRIVTPGEVELVDYVKNNDMADPQVIDDAEQFMEITESKAFQYFEDDTDSVENEMSNEYEEETAHNAAYKIANYADQFIFGKYAAAGRTLVYNSVTSANIITVLADIAKYMTIANVPESVKKRFEISPDVFTKLVIAKIVKDTDNSKTLETGFVTRMFGLDIYQSNNVVTTGVATGSTSYCLARTKKAIAYAEKLNETEKIRHPKRFGWTHRGLYLAGAKVVVPPELICVQITTAAES